MLARGGLEVRLDQDPADPAQTPNPLPRARRCTRWISGTGARSAVMDKPTHTTRSRPPTPARGPLRRQLLGRAGPPRRSYRTGHRPDLGRAGSPTRRVPEVLPQPPSPRAANTPRPTPGRARAPRRNDTPTTPTQLTDRPRPPHLYHFWDLRTVAV